jgi:predicted lipoprotein with Yx(FWY)xxD motif
MRGKWWAPAGIAAAALVVAACGSSSSSNTAGSAASSAPKASSSAPAATGSMVNVTTIKGVKVLTDAQGMTLYWFAPDSPTKSHCHGQCLKFWPIVKGPLTAGPGVTGKLGTFTRPDGKVQATYMNHQLYTYIGDTAPGQAKGNLLNAAGGLWYEMTVTGAMPAGASTSSGSGSGGSGSGGSGGSGGYGY